MMTSFYRLVPLTIHLIVKSKMSSRTTPPLLPKALTKSTAFPKTFQTSKMFPKGMQSRTSPMSLSTLLVITFQTLLPKTCQVRSRTTLLSLLRLQRCCHVLRDGLSRTRMIPSLKPLPSASPWEMTTPLSLTTMVKEIKTLPKALTKSTAFPKGTSPMSLSSLVKSLFPKTCQVRSRTTLLSLLRCKAMPLPILSWKPTLVTTKSL